MNSDESVTQNQLVLLRRIQEGEQINSSGDENLTRNLKELAQQDLIDIEENEQGITAKWLTTKALRTMAESGIFYDRAISRAQEVVNLYSIILKKEKIIDDMEKLASRSDISDEEKVKQVLGLVRHSKIEPTF